MQPPAELEMDWRKITESLFHRLMLWETDYREDADTRCLRDLYQTMNEQMTDWQDLTEWELEHEEETATC